MTEPPNLAPPAEEPGGRPPPEIRRRDRAKDDAWIRDFLSRASFGVLATLRDGRPQLNPNLFVYHEDEHCLYLHTARTGRTPESAAAGGPAAFTAASMGRFLPAPEALEFSVEYAAVVAFGSIRAADSEAEKRRALELVMRKYAPHLEPGRDYRPIAGSELRRTGVHRVDIEAWTGKENAAPPDFPGAYALLAPPPAALGGGFGAGAGSARGPDREGVRRPAIPAPHAGGDFLKAGY